MQLLEFAPVAIAFFVLGRGTSPEAMRRIRWKIESLARGDKHRDAEEFAKAKRKSGRSTL